MSDKKPSLSDEMKKMEYEPLLPAEKKMVVYNLLIGVVLLVVLVWVSHTFFPISQMQAKPVEAEGVQAVPVSGVAPAVPAANVAPAAQGKEIT